MNINQQIGKFSGAGIPGYNAKINELVEAINYLLKIRTINGKVIRDSDQGPVLDLSPVNSPQNAQPWATDPDGNSAGWLKGLLLDPNYVTNHQFDESWIWSGAVESNPLIPWMSDPDGVQAQWVQHQVCVNGNVVNKWFWGTP